VQDFIEEEQEYTRNRRGIKPTITELESELMPQQTSQKQFAHMYAPQLDVEKERKSSLISIPKVGSIVSVASDRILEVIPDVMKVSIRDIGQLPDLVNMQKSDQISEQQSATDQMSKQASTQDQDMMQQREQMQEQMQEPEFAKISPQLPANPVIPAYPPLVFPNTGMGGGQSEKKLKKKLQVELFTYAPNRKQLETIGIVPMQEPKGAKFYRAAGKGKIAEVTKSESDKIKIVDHNVKGKTMFTMPQVRMPPRKRR
jgi:hypothetical protein